MMALTNTPVNMWVDVPAKAEAKAVPAAGGCWVSVSTMSKRDRPTASEQANMTCSVEGTGRMLHRAPDTRPIVWPPTTFLGLAAGLSGVANIMKAVAPIEATAAACPKRSIRKVRKMAPKAREL